MKCVEYFYKEDKAKAFMEELMKLDYDAEPETVTTIDEDTNDTVYVVYYNPRPLR